MQSILTKKRGTFIEINSKAKMDASQTEHISGGDDQAKLVKNLESLIEKCVPFKEEIKENEILSSKHKTLEVPGISQLLPSLFLSGASAAMPSAFSKLRITCIINVAPELPDTPLVSSTEQLYLRINALDRSGIDLSQHFDEVADLIEQVRQHGGRALVHCVAGVSRSATLCIAYLMKHCNMSLREAFLYVKSIRPQIRPNSGFFQQLREYEQSLNGLPSTIAMVFIASLNREVPDVYESEYRLMEELYQRQRKALQRT